MSSSCDAMPRGQIVRGGAAGAVPARLDTVSSPIARDLVVDPRLVDDAVRDGYEAGYAAGYAEAREAAMETARVAVDQLTERLATVVHRLSDAADGLLAREATRREEIEHDIVDGAFRIAQALLGRELLSIDSMGRDAIRRALVLAPDDGLVVARLHPDDINQIGDIDALALGRALQLVADASLVPGDAVIEVGACRIDARLGDALDRINEVLSS